MPDVKKSWGGAREGAGRPPKESVAVPPELRAVLESATDAESMDAALHQIQLAAADAQIDREQAMTLMELSRERRQLMRQAERAAERNDVATRAMLLTPFEVAQLKRWRDARAKAPLKPGEYPAPPTT